MEALEIHTDATSVHWEYNTSYIYISEYIIVTSRIKQVNIPVYFLL